jgi:hypothetical protein
MKGETAETLALLPYYGLPVPSQLAVLSDLALGVL